MNTNISVNTNIEKLKARVETDGILDIKVALGGDGKPTAEELAGELLGILDAPVVQDPDLT
jgi:hypothetical protein